MADGSFGIDRTSAPGEDELSGRLREAHEVYKAKEQILEQAYWQAYNQAIAEGKDPKLAEKEGLEIKNKLRRQGLSIAQRLKIQEEILQNRAEAYLDDAEMAAA